MGGHKMSLGRDGTHIKSDILLIVSLNLTRKTRPDLQLYANKFSLGSFNIASCLVSIHSKLKSSTLNGGLR